MGEKKMGGAGKVKGSPRPSWWRDVTIKINRDKSIFDREKNILLAGVVVVLLLPNGKERPIGFFLETTPISEICFEAAEVFKDCWDPIKHCEK